MDKKQEAFLLELLNDFKIEANEHYQAIINGLIELEKNPPPPEYKQLVESAFREIHSMKGAARAVALPEIERLCMSMESLFHRVKDGNLTLTSPAFDALYMASDMLKELLSEIDTKEKIVGSSALSQMMKRLEMITLGEASVQKMDSPETPPAPAALEEPVSRPSASGPESPPLPDQEKIKPVPEPEPAEPPKNSPIPEAEKSISQETVRISTAKLGMLLREAEEFISVKASLGYYLGEIRKHRNRELAPLSREMDQFYRSLSRMIDDLLLDIKTTLLYPFSIILDIAPRIVRDLAKEFNKEINLVIKGSEIEIDRRILEEIKDPLIHIIRNCVDHGLEVPKVRKKTGKPPHGTLEIIVRQELDRKISLTIRDDGAGIEREKVIKSAVRMGVVQQEAAERMSDSEVFALIFRSGVSTSPFITDLSGRGLGMAIVAEKVSKLGGNINIASKPGQGTTFTITLPVTISNFRGVHVSVGEEGFIIPTLYVERALRIYKQEIRTAETKQVILYENENIPLVKLGDVLGVRSGKMKKDEGLPMPVLILAVAQTRIAFMVDKVFGEQEGMLKDLGPQLVHVRNIEGVTVLGNGQVLPIVNVPELLESASRAPVQVMKTDIAGDESVSEARQKYILVAEDSITLRSLLRNIIESAGYFVKTAVDGMEAFQFLKNEVFDMLISDVDMPRMNGFDLTARIRGDKTLSELPVILITALDSPEDRQRGMDSGANAYIIKGSFEQSNLLESIHRLI